MRNEFDWAEAIRNDRAAELAAAVNNRFGVDVDPEQFLMLCKYGGGVGGTSWSCSTWEMWVKRRLESACVFRGTADEEEPVRFRNGLLHVFFVAVYEDEEMLARLRRNEALGSASFARSKITTTEQYVQPIDRVAYRVAPPPDETKPAVSVRKPYEAEPTKVTVRGKRRRNNEKATTSTEA